MGKSAVAAGEIRATAFFYMKAEQDDGYTEIWGIRASVQTQSADREVFCSQYRGDYGFTLPEQYFRFITEVKVRN